MYLKHVVLDGFKSYRERTDIGPFDPHFNAITGLNGSGKSNILDAICFVLGLSSMNVVRAANLGELIYKGGTSGVSRASASLVFDNRDRSKSPVGFEKFDEIIVSRVIEANGSCKFYLNRITSTKKQITDMFESIQLNVSNPNFMIMQGKITKVINMTPKQILSMIEETVGGNVYQGKRDKTEQEIKNKDRCLELVKSTIHEEIYPEWKRQRDAREKLTEFQTIEYQNARASKYYAIMKYKDLCHKLENSEVELKRVIDCEKEDDANIEGHKKEIAANKKRQDTMKKENLDKFKERIATAEKALNSEKKTFMTVEAKLNAAKEDVGDAKKKMGEAEKAKKQQEKEMMDYKKQSSSTVGEFEEVKGQIATAQDELNKAREQENALKMGNIVDEEGKTCDARKELTRVQEEIHQIEPDYEVASSQYEEDMRKIENMEKELKNTPSNEQVEKDYRAKLQKTEQLKAEALRRNINPDDSPSEIVKSLNNDKQRLQKLVQEKEAICNQNFHLSFRYEKKDLVDSSKIKGCVYELLAFKEMEKWGDAMEVIAGGLFGQVVVEDENTGKALLRAGLCRRMTVHPLNVFKTSNNSRVTQQELDRRLGPGKAVPAIDLVECDPIYRNIVQHFFGGKVICDTIETAKKIAFEMKHWAVSKIGDVADPDGLMQGGKRENLGRLIRTCDHLRKICVEIKVLTDSVGSLQQRLQIAQSNADFMKQLDIAKRDLKNAQDTRQLTTYSILVKEIKELKEKIQQDAVGLKEKKQRLDQLEKEKKSWSNKVNQLEHLREKGKKDNAALITKWEKALAAAKKKYEAKEKHFSGIDVEIKSREALIQDCQQDIDNVIKEINDYNDTVLKITEEFKAAKQSFASVQGSYDEAVAESTEWNAEYNQIDEEIRSLEKEIHKIEIRKIKRGNLKEKLGGGVHHCESEINNLKKDNQTVNFDKEEIPPDARKSLQEWKAEAEKFRKRFDELRERIDVQAAEQFGQTKSLLSSAEDKMATIEENKKDLMSTIDKLDEHKLNIVMEAYTKVNEEFNKMMGTLLPDSAARLVAVNHADLSQGLNIHVQLGGVWKESLSELSGGQKSLVALALVLSLCMYNPAPLYILDEIDSALDLNHTQNIGVLIRRRFKDTQFVCVSLKDGMYSNCNILFQVQFNNGMSEVKRCVRQSSKETKESDHKVVSSKDAKKFNKIVSGK